MAVTHSSQPAFTSLPEARKLDATVDGWLRSAPMTSLCWWDECGTVDLQVDIWSASENIFTTRRDCTCYHKIRKSKSIVVVSIKQPSNVFPLNLHQAPAIKCFSTESLHKHELNSLSRFVSFLCPGYPASCCRSWRIFLPWPPILLGDQSVWVPILQSTVHVTHVILGWGQHKSPQAHIILVFWEVDGAHKSL